MESEAGIHSSRDGYPRNSAGTDARTTDARIATPVFPFCGLPSARLNPDGNAVRPVSWLLDKLIGPDGTPIPRIPSMLLRLPQRTSVPLFRPPNLLPSLFIDPVQLTNNAPYHRSFHLLIPLVPPSHRTRKRPSMVAYANLTLSNLSFDESPQTRSSHGLLQSPHPYSRRGNFE